MRVRTREGPIRIDLRTRNVTIPHTGWVLEPQVEREARVRYHRPNRFSPEGEPSIEAYVFGGTALLPLPAEGERFAFPKLRRLKGEERHLVVYYKSSQVWAPVQSVVVLITYDSAKPTRAKKRVVRLRIQETADEPVVFYPDLGLFRTLGPAFGMTSGREAFNPAVMMGSPNGGRTNFV